MPRNQKKDKTTAAGKKETAAGHAPDPTPTIATEVRTPLSSLQPNSVAPAVTAKRQRKPKKDEQGPAVEAPPPAAPPSPPPALSTPSRRSSDPTIRFKSASTTKKMMIHNRQSTHDKVMAIRNMVRPMPPSPTIQPPPPAKQPAFTPFSPLFTSCTSHNIGLCLCC
jgi:hypothetical protein